MVATTPILPRNMKDQSYLNLSYPLNYTLLDKNTHI